MDEPERLGSLAEGFERDLRELLDTFDVPGGLVERPPSTEIDADRDELVLAPEATSYALALCVAWISTLAYEGDALRTRLRKLERERGDSGGEQ